MIRKPRLPDFLIGGAPKCATSSLRAVLHDHPAIALPDLEFGFFDADDPISHPDFFWPKRRSLFRIEYDPPDGRFFSAYLNDVKACSEAELIGGHSTTYLTSEVAPYRIAQIIPEVRIIFMLRDPVARAYSQYWHDVHNGRVTSSFERALLTRPNIVMGSTYAPALKRYIEVFGRDRLKVLIFEDYVRDSQGCLNSVTDFLGASRMKLPDDKSWSNRTLYPRFVGTQLLLNRFRRLLVAGRYRSHLQSGASRAAALAWAADLHLRRRIPVTFTKPTMSESTQEFLRKHLSARNRGLSELVGQDLSQVWGGFEE